MPIPTDLGLRHRRVRGIFGAMALRLRASLLRLSDWLERHHHERVYMLLDEYDTSLHTAYLEGYYDDAVSFLRNLLHRQSAPERGP